MRRLLLILGVIGLLLVVVTPTVAENVINPRTKIWTYYVPYFSVGAGGWSSSLNIVNASTMDTSIGITYLRADGGYEFQKNVDLNSQQQYLSWRGEGNLPDRWVGSVRIDAYTPLAIAVHHLGPNGAAMGYMVEKIP